MTRVVINGRFLSQPVTGVQRYALELVLAIDRLLGTDPYQALRRSIKIVAPPDARALDGLEHIPMERRGRLRGHLWEQVELPLWSQGALLFSPCNTSPFLHRHSVVTLHDAAVFSRRSAYSWRFAAWNRFLFKRAWRRARDILTVSHFARRELEQACGVRRREAVVIYHGHDHMLRLQADPTILDRLGVRTRPFALAVSSRNPNKNFSRLKTALGSIQSREFTTLIAGGGDARIFADAAAAASGDVVEIGYVSDEELKALYQSTRCFVFPSLYEGFGIPPLEALACGARVLAADIPALREVFGDAVSYCDPLDPRSIASELLAVMTGPSQAEESPSRLLASLTWERSARRHLDLLFGNTT